MAGLDTNILVRWLMDDDAQQCARVADLIRSAQADGKTLFIPTTVVLELEWVLRSRYRLDKPAIARTLAALLETDDFLFENETLLEQALDFFRHGPADFADCLHAGACCAAGHAPLLTFDRAAARIPGVEWLGMSGH